MGGRSDALIRVSDGEPRRSEALGDRAVGCSVPDSSRADSRYRLVGPRRHVGQRRRAATSVLRCSTDAMFEHGSNCLVRGRSAGPPPGDFLAARCYALVRCAVSHVPIRPGRWCHPRFQAAPRRARPQAAGRSASALQSCSPTTPRRRAPTPEKPSTGNRNMLISATTAVEPVRTGSRRRRPGSAGPRQRKVAASPVTARPRQHSQRPPGGGRLRCRFRSRPRRTTRSETDRRG